MTTRKHRADWAEPWKPKERIRRIKTPYQGISPTAYQVEKRRLQYALLQLQQEVVSYNRRIALVFEGRDAAGKGSTIKRFVEHMMPKYYRIVELGVPTRQESKNWLRRYAVHMPQPCEIVFFDRSWYTRALLEPTMGYCSSSQYKYFVKRALKWEEQFVQRGVEIVKFYLSVDTETQLIRFHERMNDPLKFWKLSENDLKARKKWEVFSKYKEQMFAHTSSELLPWVFAVGVAGFASHYCLSRAMAVADATVVVPLDFLRLPVMVVVGYLLYQESLDLFLFAGASMILAGNLINVHRESRAA